MTQKPINILYTEFFSRPPKKNHTTNKTDVYYVDDKWSLSILDLNVYGPKNNRSFKFVLVVFKYISKFRGRLTLKKRNVETTKDSFEKLFRSSN